MHRASSGGPFHRGEAPSGYPGPCRAQPPECSIRRALLLAVLGVLAFHYLYTVTNQEILSSPTLLVFVFRG
jgi:hypothetical protein